MDKETYGLLGVNVSGYRIMAVKRYRHNAPFHYFIVQKHFFWIFWYTIKRDLTYSDACTIVNYLVAQEAAADYVVNLSKERAKYD